MDIFIFNLSVLLVGVAILSYFAVLLKQPIIIAYILSGVILGPWGLKLVGDVHLIESMSHLGITLLLFLAGLCLHPQHLIKLFRKTALITIANCLISFLIVWIFSRLLRFGNTESLCIALSLMFSSTILSVKLLPTLKLHHGKLGAICISILIAQDLIAIGVLAFIRCLSQGGNVFLNFSLLFIKLLIFIAVLILFEQFILRRILGKIEKFHEAIFILGLAWCFGIATISNQMGLFYETGAFFAGVVLARHPIARFISESLKPLRDFFLVLFFFVLGAKLDLFLMGGLFFKSVILAGILMIVKPILFRKFLMFCKEPSDFATEVGIRLGQLSEFSLLVALLAVELEQISAVASQFIQLTTIITFFVSSYIVVFKYPTPIGTTDQLIRD